MAEIIVTRPLPASDEDGDVNQGRLQTEPSTYSTSTSCMSFLFCPEFIAFKRSFGAFRMDTCELNHFSSPGLI
jgi:hypothetical protein